MSENKNTSVKKNRASKFFKETKSEMKKVTWPSKGLLFHNTIVILAFVAVMTVILFALDTAFGGIFKAIIG